MIVQWGLIPEETQKLRMGAAWQASLQFMTLYREKQDHREESSSQHGQKQEFQLPLPDQHWMALYSRLIHLPAVLQCHWEITWLYFNET